MLAERTGTLELLFGGSAPPSFEPDTSIDAHWFELGRKWVRETEAMHGVAADELVDKRVFFLPLAQGNTTDKITVRFDQVVAGLPVEGGRINALFTTDGKLLSLQSTGAPEVEAGDPRPYFDAGAASLIAREVFRREHRADPDHFGAPELLFARIDEGEGRRWPLAWQIDVQRLGDGSEPIGTRYTIDAHSREILRRDANVHHLDVTGTVVSFATPGVEADHSGNPPQQFPMPYMQVTSSAGTVLTDAAGNFTFPGVNTPLSVTVRYEGTFADVNNNAGGNYQLTAQNLQPNQPNTIVMNPAPNQFTTAQANTFRWINELRDWVRSVFPNDPTADFLADAQVNVNQSCNAFFTGNSTTYFIAGGGCNNTAYSSVVAHEMGHWLNVLYGTGNGSDGMGEGNADVFSMYMLDEPMIAPYFFTNGNPIRTGLNSRQFCGDQNPGCHGGTHNNGEVWMGAAWKVREELGAALGQALGDLQSNLLFLGWLNSYDQEQIRSIIEIQWLTLDDNDGDITNGTPNYAAIDAGFLQQGFPGYGLQFIAFDAVTVLENTSDEVGPYVVQADVVARLNPPIASAQLFYRVNGGGVQPVAMVNVGGNTYRAAIPGQSAPATVEYVIRGTDNGGTAETYPSANIARGLAFGIGEISTVALYEFESGPQNWVGSGNSQATGRWEHGNPVGTAAHPEDDHTPGSGTQCWFTGQGVPGGALGAADVDGGPTTLVSATFNATGLLRSQITYWRWFSNGLGGPKDDTLRVEISANNGVSWTLVEEVGPNGPDTVGGWVRRTFSPASLVTPSAVMKLRFTALDGGPESIVEVAVDDVRIESIEDPVNPPTLFCVAAPNSTGSTSTLAFAGSQSIFRNDALLRASGLPLGSLGLFFMGDQETQTPLPGSSGTRCVGGTVYRFPVVSADTLFGGASQRLDFVDPSSPARFITPGTTWRFQFWHRDAVGGAPTSNTSRALRIEFGA